MLFDSMILLGQNLHIKDVADIAAFGLLLWGVIVWARRVHAILALVGLGFLALLYLISLQLELQLMAWFFQGFFAALVIFLVVVFQDDLRRLFERIALLGLRRSKDPPNPADGGTLVRAINHIARRRWGALIVLPGRDPIERHLQGGIELDAEPSEELLLSLFDANSPGHDGAVIWVNNRIVRFGVHLPLSENREELGPGGTRHAAALGLAERCDAICIIVSEERGTISVASSGHLNPMKDTSSLRDIIMNHLSRHTVRKRHSTKLVLSRIMEFCMAFVLSLTTWAVLIPGSDRDHLIQKAHVEIQGLPANCKLVRIQPDSVAVKIEGSRRALLLTQDEPLIATVKVDPDLIKIGRRTFEIRKEHIFHDPSVELISVKPSKIFLSLRCGSDSHSK